MKSFEIHFSTINLWPHHSRDTKTNIKAHGLFTIAKHYRREHAPIAGTFFKQQRRGARRRGEEYSFSHRAAAASQQLN